MNKPVEIEFLMRDRLTSGLNNAGRSVDALGNKADMTTRRIREVGNAVESEGARIDKASKRIMQSIAAIFTVQQGAEFVKSMVDIRAEREMLEKSFEVLLQSEGKARQMVNDFLSLAMESPIKMSGIANAGQTLLGFGVEADNVSDILHQLSDISMGNQQRFESLALAYAQCQSTGKLMGQDLLQMINAGFNPLQIIAEKTGKTIGELKEEMSDGKISARDVADAFAYATAEGGKFYNMTKTQSEGIQGLKSSLENAITEAYNKLGSENSELIANTYKTATAVVQNYEPILKILATLVTAYGTYKAAIITTSAVQGAMASTQYTLEMQELTKLLPVKQQSINADIEAAVASGKLSVAKAEELVAIRAELMAKLDELKANQALAISEQSLALATHRAALQRALNAKAMVTQREMELSLARLSGDAAQIELAQKSLLEAQEERHIAVKARKATADTLSIAKSKTAAATTAVETLQTNINTASTVAATKAKNIFTLATMKLTAAMRALKVAFASNPIGLALTGIMTVVMAMTLFSNKTEEATEDVLGLARAQKKAGEEYDTQASKIKALTQIINNSKIAYDERKRALNELREIIPDYNAKLTAEGVIINNNTEAIKEYLTQLERQIKLKAAQEELEEAYKKKRSLEKTESEQSKKYWDVRSTNTLQGYDRNGLTAKISRAVGWESEDNAKKALDKTKAELSEVNSTINELNKEIEDTSVVTGSAEAPVKTFAEQMTAASEKVKTLKQELKDLRAGKGEEKDFGKAIEDKTKELDKAQKRYDLLRGIDKSTVKAGKTANHTKVEIAERKQQIEEYTRKVAAQVRESELEIEQARIDTMEDGVSKEKDQIDLNYKKLIQQNKDREADMVKELQKMERLAWENENPDYKDKGIVFTPTVTRDDLSDEQKRILQQYTEAANSYKEKADGDLLKSSLQKYSTYEQERLRIAKEFDDQIALMRANNEGGQYDGNIQKAMKEKDAAIAELDATMQSTSDFWGQLFDSFSDYTNKELQTIIDHAQEVLDYINSTSVEDIQPNFGLSAEQLKNLKGNAQELTAVYAALGEKIQQLNKRNPFGAMIRSAQMLRKNTVAVKQAQEELETAQQSGDKLAIKNAKEKLNGLQRQEKLLKGSLKDAAKAAISYLSDVGDSLQQIGAAAGDAGLESVGKALSDVAGIAQQFASGDYIGAAMNAITTGLTAIFSSNAKYRAALKQMRDDQIAFAHEYKMIMSDIRLEAEEASNAFGDDAFTKAIAALKELHSNYEDFIRLINKSDTLGGNGIFGMLKRARLEAQGITTDLQNIWIQTRHKTLFLSAKGKYLKELYPELFEGEYGFNVEAARALLNTNNQLNDEAKRQIQEVIDIYDQWQEAEEAFKEYLNQTFGEVGDSLSDSIVDAFKNGTDAMENWGQSFSNVLESLGKQLMQTIFFQKHFDKLEEDLTNLYDNYGDNPDLLGKKVQALMGSFFQNMASTVDQAEAWYENWANTAAGYGFDLTGDPDGTTQSGKSGAFQTMSQDTGTKLEGLFTYLQIHAISIDDKLDDIGSGIYGIGAKLAEVAENTKRSADKLDEVAEEIKTIKRDGLKMK